MAVVPITLTLNATADIPTGNMAYVEFDETAPYVNISGVGVIDITNFQTTFGATITSKVAKLDLFVKIGGSWLDWSVPPENITYNGSNQLLTIRWTLNAPSGQITNLYGKVY